MPRSKDAVKSTADAKGNESVDEDVSQDCSVKMKDVDQATAATEEHEAGPSARLDSVCDVQDVSVDSTLHSDTDKENDLLPRKPRRLFMITGSKKKDAKPKASGKTDVKNAKEDTQTSEANKLTKNTLDIGSNNAESNKAHGSSDVKRNSNVEEHSYEDPSVLFNNSPALQQNKNDKSSKAKKASKKTRKTKQDERPQSPGLKELAKSTESIKAAVKAAKEKHPSVMSDHSGPRSLFAFLVALLLGLIVFLSIYFLLHSHPVLSTVFAVLVYFIVFIILGFLDIRRIKCLILLTIPSSCSRGGKLALYILILYFVIKGPLCNTIGNIKTVRRSLKCTDRQRSGVFDLAAETFRAAQNCVNNFPQYVKNNQSFQTSLTCLEKSCFSVKEKLKQNCGLKNSGTSTKVCNLAKWFSCSNSKFLRNTKECQDQGQTPCRKEFDEILRFLDGDGTDDGCAFLEIIGMLLPLLILLLFHEAYKYEKCYRTYNNFHNYFLTGHFQRIDQSRSSCDREAVLPLRKVELRKHVRPRVCHLTDSEKNLLQRSLKTYMVFLLIVLFVILADLYTYRMFNIENSNTQDTRSYHHPNNKSKPFLKYEENDTSVLGNETNNVTTPSNLTELPLDSQDVCLIVVESPGSVSKVVVPILLSILLVVILFQAYFMRFQWYVCSRFYNDREKERVFYLYNKILEDRAQLVEKCKKQMKCYHREMKTLNSLEPTRILAKQVMWLSKVFKFLHINLRKCVICNDSEKTAFKICHGADCSGVYCLECSFDIDKKCLYCETELKISLFDKQAAGQDLSSKESLV